MEKQLEMLVQSYNKLVDNNTELTKALTISLEQSLHIVNEQKLSLIHI